MSLTSEALLDQLEASLAQARANLKESLKQAESQSEHSEEKHEEEEDTLPPDFLKREWAKPLTLKFLRDRFCEWLSSEHVSTQDELRGKREDFRLAAPMVEAVRHLERAAQMVGEHEALGAQIEALQVRYNDLEACQLVSAGIYEVDLADEHTARFFAEFVKDSDIEKWCLW